jgi:hypothetical protein
MKHRIGYYPVLDEQRIAKQLVELERVYRERYPTGSPRRAPPYRIRGCGLELSNPRLSMRQMNERLHFYQLERIAWLKVVLDDEEEENDEGEENDGL